MVNMNNWYFIIISVFVIIYVINIVRKKLFSIKESFSFIIANSCPISTIFICNSEILLLFLKLINNKNIIQITNNKDGGYEIFNFLARKSIE